MHSAVGQTKIMSINDIIPIFDVVLPPGAAPSQELHGEIFNFWALFHLVRLEGRLAFCEKVAEPTNGKKRKIIGENLGFVNF